MRRKRGPVSRKLIQDIRPLEFLENGTPLYPICGAEDDVNPDDEGDPENENEDEDDPSDEDDPPKPKPKAKPKETDAQKIRRLNAENKKRREDLEAAQKVIRDAEDKDKSELELAKRDLEEFRLKHEGSDQTIADLRIENAFLKLDRDKYNWHDPDDVIEKIRKDLEISEDGTVEGLEEAVKALAKAKPYLLKSGEDDGEEPNDPKRTKPLGASGAPVGSGRRSKQEATKQAARAKTIEKYNLDKFVPVQR